ncbi:MAG: cupin domain-containing protein [Christensenellales bacterium]|jgi:mannose-6-phosphate isomerase-like protein (cupin superfamily)
MVIKKENMPKEARSAWRGGEGAPVITHLCPENKPANWRFMALVDFKPGESIGEHAHNGETELYYILKGEATVIDNGVPVKVYAGDAIVTGNGASHSIQNTGAEDLSMLAVIVND